MLSLVSVAQLNFLSSGQVSLAFGQSVFLILSSGKSQTR
jgi:hypothetical protein